MSYLENKGVKQDDHARIWAEATAKINGGAHLSPVEIRDLVWSRFDDPEEHRDERSALGIADRMMYSYISKWKLADLLMWVRAQKMHEGTWYRDEDIPLLVWESLARTLYFEAEAPEN